MVDKKEVLSKFYNMPIEEICCKNCDRKVKQSNEKPYCSWFKVFCKDENTDVCKYFLNTQNHK